MADWHVDLAAFSETSHTLRAVSAIRSEFKAIGHRLAFGRSVDDKFPVKSSAGSFRGKSSGVAVSSVLPVFSFEDERVSACVWASCRLVHTVVQSGHLPIHVLVAYLHPCACVGSEKHEINSRILSAAASVLEGLHGPALLVGDWLLNRSVCCKETLVIGMLRFFVLKGMVLSQPLYLQGCYQALFRLCQPRCDAVCQVLLGWCPL